jgi:hypothetical protein
MRGLEVYVAAGNAMPAPEKMGESRPQASTVKLLGKTCNAHVSAPLKCSASNSEPRL